MPEQRMFYAESLEAAGTPVPYPRAVARPDNAAEDDKTNVHLDAELAGVTPAAFAQRHEGTLSASCYCMWRPPHDAGAHAECLRGRRRLACGGT